MPDLRVAFWNLQNLFDTKASELATDLEFTPAEGWTEDVLAKKLKNLAQVIGLMHAGKGPDGKAAVFRPTNLAFAPDGGFYVGDGYGSNYIHQYSKDVKWVRTWGGLGTELGKMQTPHGIWLDHRPGPLHLDNDVVIERTGPSLIVADRANARLQYFTLDGKPLGLISDALFPAHFDIRGDVLLVPDLHARVSLFDKNNKAIVHLGDDPEWRKVVLDGFKVRANEGEWQPGKFVHPHDACFDRDGNIFVVEWVATGRVTLLRHVS